MRQFRRPTICGSCRRREEARPCEISTTVLPSPQCVRRRIARYAIYDAMQQKFGMKSSGSPHLQKMHASPNAYRVSVRKKNGTGWTTDLHRAPFLIRVATNRRSSRSSWRMSETFSTRYAALIATGKIEADPGQATLARHLAALERRLDQHRLARKSSSLGWLFGKREQAGAPLKGLYIYGEVGRGKTMLMDLFFQTSAVVRKRRVHFHEFMADVHERIHVFRQELKNGEGSEFDPIQRTAALIAGESSLLCFDEFHVTDIADAMILGRLFTRLFELGVIMVATSNLAPRDLYREGLNRALFLPFIVLLERHCDIIRLEARIDF